MGLAISGLTFVVCVFYLLYDWRREKGDKRARKLEKKIKNRFARVSKIFSTFQKKNLQW